MNIRFEAEGKERILQRALALCGGEDSDRARLNTHVTLRQR